MEGLGIDIFHRSKGDGTSKSDKCHIKTMILVQDIIL